MHVVFLSLSPSRREVVVKDMEYLLGCEATVTVVTADRDAWEDLDPRVTVLALAPDEQRHWIFRVAAATTRLRTQRIMRRYRRLRPWVLWQVARRSVLPLLDLGQVDQIVVADTLAVPLGWQIARAHPEVNIGFTLDREAISGCLHGS